MASSTKLRQLRSWVKEFKHRFRCNRRVYCHLGNLAASPGACTDRPARDVEGRSNTTFSRKSGHITLDPKLAWKSDVGARGVALHEFLHLLNRWDSQSDDGALCEEAAVERLTGVYMKQFDL